jgi:hypothetical protein
VGSSPTSGTIIVTFEIAPSPNSRRMTCSLENHFFSFKKRRIGYLGNACFLFSTVSRGAIRISVQYNRSVDKSVQEGQLKLRIKLKINRKAKQRDKQRTKGKRRGSSSKIAALTSILDYKKASG